MAECCGYINKVDKVCELLKGKKVIISIETTSASDIENTTNGRYKHNPQYLEKILQTLGFTKVDIESIILRKEHGEDVEGAIVVGE